MNPNPPAAKTTRGPKAGPTATTARDADPVLDSWKAIAHYFGRTVRTVQRWEREQGLPVRRQIHNSLGSVSASVRELDAWRESRTRRDATAPVSQAAARGMAAITSSDAHRRYLCGRHYFDKRTREGIVRAIQEFRLALDHEPAWALPYCGIADAYLMLSGNEFWAPDQGYPKARAVARHALTLDPTLPEAHTVLGYVAAFHDADWTAARRHFDHAVSLNPGYANAHYWDGMVAMNVGRFREAEAKIRYAADLAPLSPVIMANIGRPLLCRGRYAEALVCFQRALDIEPEFWIAHGLVGFALEALGQYQEAMAAFGRAAQAPANHIMIALSVACVHARAGDIATAHELLAKFTTPGTSDYLPPVRIARVYASLGDHETALDWLRRAMVDRSIRNNTYLMFDYAFRPLRNDPRFRGLVSDALALPTLPY